GAGKKDIDQLIDALCSYLRGCTIYAPVAGDPTDELERSLAGAMTCCGFIADLEPNKEKKQLYKSRNAQYKEQLKQQFPNSPYLKN
ncbi:MAG TPA: hypothetical protein VM509_08155, partial [Planctomycetota bacterium]|nr:hypothetical protein [Planctomycetota bacterium]